MSNNLIPRVAITTEMKKRAEEEAKKRDPHIKHHFDVSHFSGKVRDVVGFLGEFACCEYLGLNWRDNIRENYLTIDTGDIQGRFILDIKTETLPEPYFSKLLNHKLEDDGVYGRRLINGEQKALLHKYDFIVFGAFCRDRYDYWYPLGFMDTKFILQNYRATQNRPDGGSYPAAGLPIKTSELKPMEELRALFGQ